MGAIPEPELDTQALKRAMALHRQGQLEQAESLYRQLGSEDPRHPGAAHMLGLVLLQQGKAAQAVEHLQRAMALGAEPREVLGHLGDALKATGQAIEALQAYQAKLQKMPGDVDTLFQCGLALHALQRYEEAVECHEAALRQRPDGPRILFSCANALVELGRFDEAMARFDRCIAIAPDFDGAYRNRGILKLLLGDLAGGWPDYEHRRPKPADREIAPLAPDWLGEDLAGKSLLVSDATGLGDAIQFIRYLPLAAGRGARVSFLGNRRLFRLFEPLASSIELLSSVPAGRQFDFHCKLLSLPGLFDTRMDTIPAAVPYLFAEPARVAKWAARIGDHGYRIGISWKGNPSRTIDAGRSVPLAEFATIGRLPGVRLISLQKRYGLEQLQSMPEGMQVESPGDDLDKGDDAFVDSAALMQHLDLVISSDTSTLHVAGALGRPAFLALKFVPEWRWFLNRDDTLWYPSVRLFRQPRRDDWRSAFENMAKTIGQRRSSG